MAGPMRTPWHGPGAPEDDALDRLLRAEGLSPGWWENAAGERYATHAHAYHKVLYCGRGSIAFFLPDSGGRIELLPGDRMDLPPHTRHSALVGPGGVRCIEAPRRD